MTRALRGPARVLVVDDDEVDRERVRRFLAKTEIETTVLEESDPVAALCVVRRSGADVVVLDYHFPKHDGLTVLRELREIDSLTPVIVLTGHDDVALAVELMKAGAADYVAKSSLTPARLGQAVRHALRIRRAELATRAAQDALRASEQLSRGVIEASHDCIKVLSREGNVLTMNSKGQERLGIDDFSTVVGKPWVDFWDDRQRAGARAALDEALAGRVGRFLGSCPNRRGEMLWWDVQITALAGGTGGPDRLLAVSRDVTGQRRQAEFEQQLVGIVSHDLRNPISVITMAGMALEQQLPPHHAMMDTAQRITRQGKRATRLIHDLLDLTQVRLVGALSVSKIALDAHAVCRQVVGDLATAHPTRQIVHVAEGDGAGRWDAERIAQIIDNLARNALSYGSPEQPVAVRSRAAGPAIRLEVHNHGAAIAREHLGGLFQPLTRGGRTHDEGRSIGLGLFIVREIAAAHGGTTGVRSTHDEGTTFWVELPRE